MVKIWAKSPVRSDVSVLVTPFRKGLTKIQIWPV